MRQVVKSTAWSRNVATGALWAIVYNFVWGVAWFAFMRDAWTDAMSTVGRKNPWTAEVWFIWVLLTFPIGVAVMVYASGHPKAPPKKAAAYAAVALWVPMALAMGVWAWQESLPMRVIVLDSAVNLAAMVAASLAAGGTAQQKILTRTPRE